MMWRNGLVAGFFLLTFAISGFISAAGATEYTYIGLDNGEWTTTTNWSPPPQSPYLFPYGDLNSARINADPATNVNVYLDAIVSLNKLQVDAGDSLTFRPKSDHAVRFELTGTNPSVINNGVITLHQDNVYFGLLGDLTATFSGTGTLNMVTGSSLQGSSTAQYINDSGHTIRGAGWIVANMENRGNIIADGGELHFHGNTMHQSATGILATAGPGSLLSLSNNFWLYGGRLNPNGGEVRLDNVNVFDGTSFGPGKIVVGAYGASLLNLNGDFTTAADFIVTRGATLALWSGGTITNTGTILVESNGVTQLKAFNQTAVFTGTGSIVLGGLDSRLSQEGGGSFGNDVNHTIRGAGTINAPVYNAGTIIAENGTLVINQPIMRAPLPYGPGQIEVKTGGTLDVKANVETGNLIMGSEAMLYVGNLKIIDLKGDFIFEQQNAAYWSWGAGSVLQMSGEGGLQRLEVGGTDYLGTPPQAFSNNFDLPSLKILGAGTQAYLTDLIDNGHRSSPEALYVESLFIESGSTLFLNGINLYTFNGLVEPGTWVNGGGLVSAGAVPLPGSVILLGSGLLGLGFLGWRRKQD
jgi:hypothetical protein